MKTRIIAGVSMAAALLFLVLIAPKGLAALVYGVLMAIGAYELLYGTGLVRHTRLVLYSCAMAFAVTLWSYFNAIHAYLLLLLLIFAVAMFAEMMADHVKVFYLLVLQFVLARFD